MSASDRERIILSYINIRGPSLESVYQIVRNQGNTSYDTLTDLFSIPDDTGTKQVDQVRGCVNFLASAGILKVKETSSNKEVTLASDLGDMPFRLILLNKLRLDKKNPFSLVHSHLVENDALRFDLQSLKQSVEKSLELDFTWNDEKLNFWMDLAEYLGLGRKYPSSRVFASYPTSELLLSIALIYECGKRKKLKLKDFLDYVSSNFFECWTRTNKLYNGLQQTLQFLQAKRTISLVPASSDDPNAVLLKEGNEEKAYGSISFEGV